MVEMAEVVVVTWAEMGALEELAAMEAAPSNSSADRKQSMGFRQMASCS